MFAVCPKKASGPSNPGGGGPPPTGNQGGGTPAEPAVEGYARKSDRLVSTTDPDAVAMKTRGERATLGYHTHYATHLAKTYPASICTCTGK